MYHYQDGSNILKTHCIAKITSNEVQSEEQTVLEYMLGLYIAYVQKDEIHIYECK
jgi:hypothetical protein